MDEKAESKEVHSDHYCEAPNCKKWGSYGFYPRSGGAGHYFCREHKHLGEELMKRHGG